MGVRNGGRQKGTPNKDKNELVEMLKRECKNYRDPLAILMDGACGEPVTVTIYVPAEKDADGRKIGEGRYEPRLVYPDLDQQHACAKEVSQYIHAKRKAVEVTGEIETGAQVHFHIPGAAGSMEAWSEITGMNDKVNAE